MQMRTSIAMTAVLLFSLATNADQTSSKTLTPVVVELFTSEGCSSCPPADTFLRDLDRTQPISGAELIVLSEHVDYWDDLGWKDSFSSHDVTERQKNYARRLRLSGPYTPQMVVDGTSELVGSDRARAARAFDQAKASPKVAVRISSLASDNRNVRAHIETDSLPAAADVFVALTQDRAQSQVLHGENGGRRLEHVAVLRQLVPAGHARKGESLAKDVSLRLDLPAQPSH